MPFFLKKPIKQSKPKPVSEAQPSLPTLWSQKELEKGFCWWQKWFLVGPHPFSSPTLGCLLMCSGLEVRTSSFSLVNIWNSSSNFESKRWFCKWKFSALCNHYEEDLHFLTICYLLFLRVLSSLGERPFGVRFCFSVLVFPGSESAERKAGLMCVSFPAKWSVWEND